LKTCGIYGIRNKITDRIYVGKSVEIEIRFSRHKTELKHNKHYNDHLQRSFNKYGADAFEFVILEQCEPNLLPRKEQFWINEFNNNLYNFDLFVEDKVGNRNSFFGKKHTEEAKIKMGLKKKTMYVGPGNPNYGKKQPKSTVLKMIQNNSGTKLTPETVLNIVELLKQGLPHQQIADQFNIARSVITRISSGARWANITGGPVVPVVYKDGIRQFGTEHRGRIGNARRGKKHTDETKELMRQKALKRSK
jgi:group I intron endonuclease